MQAVLSSTDVSSIIAAVGVANPRAGALVYTTRLWHTLAVLACIAVFQAHPLARAEVDPSSPPWCCGARPTVTSIEHRWLVAPVACKRVALEAKCAGSTSQTVGAIDALAGFSVCAPLCTALSTSTSWIAIAEGDGGATLAKPIRARVIVATT